MHKSAASTSADQIIITLAGRDGGVVTMAALTTAGVSRWTVRRRVDAGLLERVATGLFVVPAMATDMTELWIAQLATGGSISHQSALRLHGIAIPGRDRHVLIPKGGDNAAPGARVHETRLWFDDDMTTIDGLPVTTASRALIDVVGPFGENRWTRAAQQLVKDGTVSPDDLIATFQRLDRSGRGRRRETAALVSTVAGGNAMSESVLEDLVFDGLVARGVQGLVRQYRPPWYEGVRGIVDIADPIGMTIVEADGRTWHSTTDAMEDDHARDRNGASRGFLTLRLGWREVTKYPDRTLGEAASIIIARRNAALQRAA